jgi:hypothetical protein
MGQWVSVGVAAFIMLLFLSVSWVIALVASWAIVVPESLNGDITPGGKRLLYARYLFTAACGIILISLLLDVFVRNPAGSSDLFWIWDVHPHVLVLLLVISAGLSIVASFYAFQSKGNGRWVLWAGAPSMAALSIIEAIILGQSI